MNLWFLTDSAIAWSRERLEAVNTLDLGGGVDGAEAMTVGLCQHLSGRGHDVTLWATHLEAPGTYGYDNRCVRWRSVERELRHALMHEHSPDVFISVRRPEVFNLPEYQSGCSAYRLLWAHDVFDRKQAHALINVGAVVYMSKWHRAQWEAEHPPLANNNFLGWITPAAFEPDWIPPASPADHERHTFIYSSRPERGLLPLLSMWPRIRQQLPGATLIITGYTAGTSDLVKAANKAIYETDDAVGGIDLARSSDKRGFYRQLRRARLMLYPGVPWFTETNGHVTSEAMVCGVVPVVTGVGALGETIPQSAGVLLPGDSSTTEYKNNFLRAVNYLTSKTNDQEVRAMQEAGYQHVMPRCSYAAVAKLWEEGLYSLPRKGARVWVN